MSGYPDQIYFPLVKTATARVLSGCTCLSIRYNALTRCEGSKTGCEHYCSGTTDHQKLWSARFEYCSYLRNQLPTDLRTSCSNGFTSASEGANSFTTTNAPIDDDADSKEEDVVVRNTKKASPKSVKHAKVGTCIDLRWWLISMKWNRVS